MRHITDRDVFQAIWDKYHKKFEENNAEYDVEIDLRAVACKLRIDYGILWGRFYYDMNEYYTYEDNRKLFYPITNSDKVLVHFPLLYAVLSRETEMYISNRFIPSLSVLVACISVLASLLIR